MYKKLLAILMVIFSFASFAKDKLKIGVTLQPYYSFAVNIVKDKAEVPRLPSKRRHGRGWI